MCTGAELRCWDSKKRVVLLLGPLAQQKPQRHIFFITINVPLFKKLRDIIFFWWENHFMSHFEGHFVGAKTFLTP
jgi:hypothetical protein